MVFFVFFISTIGLANVAMITSESYVANTVSAKINILNPGLSVVQHNFSFGAVNTEIQDVSNPGDVYPVTVINERSARGITSILILIIASWALSNIRPRPVNEVAPSDIMIDTPSLITPFFLETPWKNNLPNPENSINHRAEPATNNFTVSRTEYTAAIAFAPSIVSPYSASLVPSSVSYAAAPAWIHIDDENTFITEPPSAFFQPKASKVASVAT